MKPLVSIIPEPDRSTVVRKPLTPKQRAELALVQGGICGCGCGVKMNHALEGTIDEHMNPLGLTGTNDLANRRLFRLPCAKAKTVGDKGMIAKAKRLAGETCTGEPARKLQGRGFGNRVRKLDDSIGPTRKALRQAASDETSRLGTPEGVKQNTTQGGE